jgi:hypothetical protein
MKPRLARAKSSGSSSVAALAFFARVWALAGLGDKSALFGMSEL